ncbi:FAD-dependent monooxygenase [Williamsia soli]|uniref:FAD-dependent monooxygenase n=1 Tax=Williamsia soli TaxID=364929 RepID=UPI001A9FD740|nr:FAD-dependent monooxygenase [Williamsia soli]
MAVLVSGASIAGLSVAYWLDRFGFDVTVVERAPALRVSGSPIDIRGDALQVASAMGIAEKVHDQRVATSGRNAFTTWVDAHGGPIAVLPNEYAADSPDDIEIARDNLIAILHEAIGPGVEFVYNDSIDTVVDTGGEVEVALSSGRSDRYDHVVGADGIHSTVREAVFGPEHQFRRHLDTYTALVDLPLGSGTSGESITFSTPGKMFCINDYVHRTIGFMAVRTPEVDYDNRDLADQKLVLAALLDGEGGWRSDFLMRSIAETDRLYFDSVSQVHMPQWSQGRVVLIGDAAHAASLFSGRGTSLAMIGAHHLATELAATPSEHAEAFGRYEQLMRPRVVTAQEGVSEARDFLVPATESELRSRNERFAVDAAR